MFLFIQRYLLFTPKKRYLPFSSIWFLSKSNASINANQKKGKKIFQQSSNATSLPRAFTHLSIVSTHVSIIDSVIIHITSLYIVSSSATISLTKTLFSSVRDSYKNASQIRFCFLAREHPWRSQEGHLSSLLLIESSRFFGKTKKPLLLCFCLHANPERRRFRAVWGGEEGTRSRPFESAALARSPHVLSRVRSRRQRADQVSFFFLFFVLDCNVYSVVNLLLIWWDWFFFFLVVWSTTCLMCITPCTLTSIVITLLSKVLPSKWKKFRFFLFRSLIKFVSLCWLTCCLMSCLAKVCVFVCLISLAY